MATYDIATHKLLSDDAQKLQNDDPDIFDAHVIAAEMLHDLYSTNYINDQKETARLILVYQVNYQLENDQNSELYERITRGERDYHFRSGAPPKSSTAEALREKLDQDEDTENENANRVKGSTTKSNTVIW